MVLGKKGIVFSLLAIGLSGLFIIYFSSYYEIPLDHGNSLVNTRVNTLNNGIDDFYDFAQDALIISAYSSLQEMYTKINETTPPTYFSANTFEDKFLSCTKTGMYNATHNCNNANNYTGLLAAQQARLLSALRMDITPTINWIELSDENWLYFTLKANISYEVHDSFASWSGFRIVQVRVPTFGLYDPAFLQIAYDMGFIRMLESPHHRIKPSFVQDSEWNYELFDEFFQQREYLSSNNGPCLSQRYEGNWSSPKGNCGMETTVDITNYPNLFYTRYENFSHLDYQILNEINYSCFDTSFPNSTFLVGIDEMPLTLSSDVSSRFNIEANWTQSGGVYTSPKCP